MVVDPYFDESIGDLRNLLGATSSEELRDKEAQVVFANETELENINIPRSHDADELLAIHKQLFKGVYDWAGKIRTVDIKKNADEAEFFLIVSKLPTAFEFIFNELRERNYLDNLSREDFIEQLAYFYDQLNYIHPFREGNGRTQRIFWSRLAENAGYEIEWDKIVGDENDTASRLAAEKEDRSALMTMFGRIVKPLA